MYLHKFLKIYENNVDIFISPSNFLKEKILEWEILKPEKIIVMPHFINLERFKINQSKTFSKAEKNYFLYFGRLSHEKGLKTLISAMKYVKDGKLLIAGTGPEEKGLKIQIKKENLTNIKFLSYLNFEELKSVIQKCLFTVLPSIVYESFGLTILESYAFGKAVLGSNLGAIPEIVKNEKTGLLFEAGNIKDLANKINLMLANKERTREMGKQGQKKIELEHRPEQYYEKLIKIYNLLKRKNKFES
jgi:glycosyltransferase involved in cell wall biosynthesis